MKIGKKKRLSSFIGLLFLAGCIHTQDKATELDTYVSYPSTEKKNFPVIIMSHGAGGLDRFYFEWASHFRKLGFATIIVDHHTSRGYLNRAKPSTDNGYKIRQADLVATFNKLDTIPNIDKKRIWLAGWSSGAGFVFDGIDRKGVLGAFLFYPYSYACRLNIIDSHDKPVKILIGERDAGLPHCWEKYVDDPRYDFSIYDDTYHCFDYENIKTIHEVHYRQYTLELLYNEKALNQSRIDVTKFLQHRTPGLN